MASTNIEVPIADVSKRLSVNVVVTGMRTWNMRMQATVALIKLAAWIAPVGKFDVEVNHGNDVNGD